MKGPSKDLESNSEEDFLSLCSMRSRKSLHHHIWRVRGREKRERRKIMRRDNSRPLHPPKGESANLGNRISLLYLRQWSTNPYHC